MAINLATKLRDGKHEESPGESTSYTFTSWPHQDDKFNER